MAQPVALCIRQHRPTLRKPTVALPPTTNRQPPTADHRLVESLRPFPGQVHLDVAGGTGDVAFRVLRAVRAAEMEEKMAAAASGSGAAGAAGGPFRPRPSAPPSEGGQAAAPGEAGGAAAGPWPGSSSGGGGGGAARGAGSGGDGGLAAGRVVVCDINPDMLRVGQQKAAGAADLSGDPGLSFVEGNAEALPFDDASFDSYTVAFGIRNVTDRPAALREALRVLRPGGRFMCLEFSRVTQPGLRELYDLYSFAVIPRIGGLVANDAASYQYLVESIRQFPDQEAFAHLVEEAGFRAVTYESLMGGVVAIHSGFKL
ncbi:2-methoxy-6-polyprenyl-1,4-benzoquinol methylase, mitochondrial [Tetrabaena socialis]|uniref:2-methoxy-6-polyprenyl-1,4-benzoquinol methylase, mitochondrial n=1 Tax=Tetrabaena socialis TaxID=47790 RepID=A0A2J8AFQ1_9CHLO|nr:2-methoxy-6-polyprenyl-1,4-benzoquinol methylase, mitochondrial [Tetrabaena socialis]|eukprot:PNH11322.1 2-methoxy-6-polyprenyl-1,4-benzoquinol methylase, mitochondrial [Tetrabaena socialis]